MARRTKRCVVSRPSENPTHCLTCSCGCVLSVEEGSLDTQLSDWFRSAHGRARCPGPIVETRYGAPAGPGPEQ